MPSIFEFDETISRTHTFTDYCIDSAVDLNAQYDLGKKTGQTNLKKDVEIFFNHDENELCGIVTFHNNADFVAGNIATLLKKELTLVDISSSSSQPKIAINHYQVEGLDKPLLICYLPHFGEEHTKALNELGNANRQIKFLRQTWIEKNLIERTSTINFFDSSIKNHQSARFVPYVNSFHVLPKDDSFVLTKPYYYATINEQRPTNIEQFDAYLTEIRDKAQQLKKDGHVDAALVADELYKTLFAQFDSLYFGTMGSKYIELPEFKANCSKAIEEAHLELDKHRGWKELLGNIALSIFTLGVGLIVKGIYNVSNDKPFLFFGNTASGQLLNNTEEFIDSMTAGAANV